MISREAALKPWPYILLAALVLPLGGCAHGPARGQVDTPVTLTNCDHPSGWCDQIRQTAGQTWRYAQMSANAYDTPVYDLGPEVREIERQDNDAIGYAYVVFERRPAGGTPEWVIAFRGTENHNPVDWVNGNLLGRQNRRGLATYDTLRQRLGAEAKISVTGHSLGGGIATYVSLCRANTDSYIFNSSPRFRDCRPRAENKRQSVVERGEFLKVGRLFGNEATQTYTSVNCVRGTAPIRQHGIASLADCLARAAAWADPAARASLIRNTIALPSGLPPT